MKAAQPQIGPRIPVNSCPLRPMLRATFLEPNAGVLRNRAALRAASDTPGRWTASMSGIHACCSCSLQPHSAA